MLKTPNSTISTELAALSSKAGAKISSAIQSASQKTGVDFSYLLQQAQVESSFKADAKAKTSSATGLYQFIDRTWLQMVNKYGDKYGLSQYADQISDTGKVANSKIKAEILNLRNDAKICSLMAGELACENKNYLESKVSGDIGSTELYMAHFMGPGGASKFLNALRSNPTASAADAFPQAA
ncbi:MAG TPA: transglycosylase SLT domain-containing protein, partial [Alphaproteobacteria bacterium]|nr:transglycosylase SLT domain-containing protein [Alphaproteobacteria bacterium]